MFEAQLLIAKSGSDVLIYSGWSSRQGDYMRATVEVVGISSANCTLQTTLYSKDSEETTDGAVVDAAVVITQTATGRSTEEWGPSTGTGLNELVRYRFKVTQSGGALEWVLFRVLPPVWFDAVKA